MPLPTQYDATAGFPDVHIAAFKQVSSANRMVISSRGLNPLCTDLLLEGYAAKGYHIKAKTCDWGPMAGFVPADHRYTKAGQSPEKQRAAVADALRAGARRTPLVISSARMESLRGLGKFIVTAHSGRLMTVDAAPGPGQAPHTFILVKQIDCRYWAICYPRPAGATTGVAHGAGVQTAGLEPLRGLTNPGRGPAAIKGAAEFRSAVCGDYDLWCIFPHATLESPGINDRQASLKATLTGPAARHSDGIVASRALQAGLILPPVPDPADMADLLGDPHLGNISHAVLRVRQQLNRACHAPGGDVVMHADYGGYAFGAIDYPIIFFIPRPDTGFQQVDHAVATSLATLKPLLKRIEAMGYRVEPNPAWSLPNVPPGRSRTAADLATAGA
ncbi:Anthrax toxin edema factor central domain-containing protein [Bordetella sputigena]|uniref:anthrax toxin-like adenylyl cyclase domain-containing protein n=1 Tax=Bordetella sputigena TaxID=1416810 RepID=UPI0039EF96E3